MARKKGSINKYFIDPKVCSDCKYRAHANNRVSFDMYAPGTCDYCAITHHSRPKENSHYGYCEAKEVGRKIKLKITAI